MEKVVKNLIITFLIIVAVFIVGLMDDKKITSLTVDNTIAKNANKVVTTTTNKQYVSMRLDKNKIYFNSNEPNIVSNISDVDLKNLLRSKKDSWKIFNEQNNIVLAIIFIIPILIILIGIIIAFIRKRKKYRTR